MDVQKIGLLIAELRREKGLTQKELAAKLRVSDRAVSKWERGLNLPNSELFEPLCKILGISVMELLRGEKNTGNQIPVEEAERAVYDAAALARMKQQKLRKLRWGCVVVVCLLLIYGAMVRFAGKIVEADHPYPEVTIQKVGADITEILSHQGTCYTPESTDTRAERLKSLSINLPADVTGRGKPRTFEFDHDTVIRFVVEHPIEGMKIQVLRWAEELRGTGAGLEAGEEIPIERLEEGQRYEWKFEAESGYLYAVLVTWGEGYFVEYPFLTTSIYQ